MRYPKCPVCGTTFNLRQLKPDFWPPGRKKHSTIPRLWETGYWDLRPGRGKWAFVSCLGCWQSELVVRIIVSEIIEVRS